VLLLIYAVPRFYHGIFPASLRSHGLYADELAEQSHSSASEDEEEGLTSQELALKELNHESGFHSFFFDEVRAAIGARLWVLVMMLRKVFLIVILVIFKDRLVQVTWGVCLIAAVLLAAIYISPYSLKILNDFQMASSTILLLNVVAFIPYGNNYEPAVKIKP
jgi:hypothetical protein